jgi:hypothetical protein
LKIKRQVKTKNPARKAKKAIVRDRKQVLAVKKPKKAVAGTKKPTEPDLTPSVNFVQPAAQATDVLSPFAALVSEHTIAHAWDILGDEEFILDDEVWNTFYNRIKLQLLQASYSFRVETDGVSLSPWSVTPMPAFRSNNEPGFLKAGSFTVLKPELPGVIFDLKISANDHALLIDWSLRRKDSASSTGHMALYCDGELIEAVNLNQNRCQMELTREDLGDISFYFLDAETGRQIKILELCV